MLFQRIVSVVSLTAALLQGSMDAAMPDKDVEGTAFLVNREHAVSKDYVPEVRKTDV